MVIVIGVSPNPEFLATIPTRPPEADVGASLQKLILEWRLMPSATTIERQ